MCESSQSTVVLQRQLHFPLSNISFSVQYHCHHHGRFFKNPNVISLGKFKGCSVDLIWGNIREITGIEYHHKDYVSDLTALFSEIYHNKLTRDLLQTLIEGNVPVSFTLQEMIDYFPTLE